MDDVERYLHDRVFIQGLPLNEYEEDEADEKAMVHKSDLPFDL